jgi:hypothetical protein
MFINADVTAGKLKLSFILDALKENLISLK